MEIIIQKLNSKTTLNDLQIYVIWLTDIKLIVPSCNISRTAAKRNETVHKAHNPGLSTYCSEILVFLYYHHQKIHTSFTKHANFS